MTEKLKYTNQKGQVYFFRTATGKRGSQIVCSQGESADDLAAIPDTHEIVENPNGQVSCRKKIKCDIAPDESSYVQDICPGMVDPKIRIFVETKKKAIIIHCKETAGLHHVFERLPVHPSVKASLLADSIPFEPVLKLELADKKKRTFAIYRMCWVGGEADWLFLDEGSLAALLEEYVPHIGQESFYELV